MFFISDAFFSAPRVHSMGFAKFREILGISPKILQESKLKKNKKIRDVQVHLHFSFTLPIAQHTYI